MLYTRSILVPPKTGGYTVTIEFQYLERKPRSNAGPLSWSNWNLEMLVFVEGGRPENPEKNPRSKARTNSKLKPQNRTQATLVGGGRSSLLTKSHKITLRYNPSH